MPITISLPEQDIEKAQTPKSLDEAVWDAWLNRNAAKDRRKHAFRMEAIRWSCIALLLLAAGLSFQHAFAYPILVTKAFQFALTIGATAFAWQTSSLRRYVVAMPFVIVALLFNPLLLSSWLFRNAPVLLISTLPFFLVPHWESVIKARTASLESFHAE